MNNATAKPFWKSKTYAGVAITLVAQLLTVLLPALGVQLLDAEINTIANLVVSSVGALLAMHGRNTAAAPIKSVRPGPIVSGLLAGVMIASAAGCTFGKNVESIADMPPHKQANAVVKLLVDTWNDMDDGYHQAWPYASESDRQWMSDNLDPALATARPLLTAAGNAAMTWNALAVDGCPEGAECSDAMERFMSAKDSAIRSMKGLLELYSRFDPEAAKTWTETLSFILNMED